MLEKKDKFAISSRFEALIILFLAFIVGITYIVYGIYGEKYIMWDGCNYLARILFDGKFFLYPRGRMSTDIMMQGFAVAAWHLGCDNPAMIGALQGFGITFSTVVLWFLAISVCLAHKRNDYAKLMLIYSCMSLTFKGLFLQMESTIAVPLYLYQFMSILLWEEKKEKLIQRIVFFIILLCSVHMNEFFVFWDIVLICTVLYRIFIDRSLGKKWLLIAGFFVGNIFICISDIRLYSAYVDNSVYPLEQLRLIFYNKVYLVSCIVVFAVIALSLFAHDKKWSAVLIMILSLCLFAFQFYWYRKEAMTIGMWAFPTRLSCLGWGLLAPILIGAVHFFTRKKMLIGKSLLVLCIALSLTTAFYNRRTGHEYHNYNTQRMLMCIANPEQGFLDYRETPIADYGYVIAGTMQLECEELLILRGVKEIDTILVGSDVRDELADGYDKYGVVIRKEFFK